MFVYINHNNSVKQVRVSWLCWWFSLVCLCGGISHGLFLLDIGSAYFKLLKSESQLSASVCRCHSVWLY